MYFDHNTLRDTRAEMLHLCCDGASDHSVSRSCILFARQRFYPSTCDRQRRRVPWAKQLKSWRCLGKFALALGLIDLLPKEALLDLGHGLMVVGAREEMTVTVHRHL